MPFCTGGETPVSLQILCDVGKRGLGVLDVMFVISTSHEPIMTVFRKNTAESLSLHSGTPDFSERARTGNVDRKCRTA